MPFSYYIGYAKTVFYVLGMRARLEVPTGDVYKRQLATSVASFAGAIIMIIVLRKRIGNMHLKRSSVQFIKILIAAGACAVVTILLHQFLPIEGTAFGHNAARLLSSGLSGIAVFAIVAYLLKIEMAGKLMRGAKNRLRRKKT